MSNTPTPRTDAHINSNYTAIGHAYLVVCHDFARQLEQELNETKLWIEKSNTAQYVMQVEAERDKAKELLSHFITHYEALDYSEATLDELEKIAVGLWSVVKERDQLRKVVDELANIIYVHSLRPQNALDGYNQLPHI